jgi:hypothetical protein
MSVHGGVSPPTLPAPVSSSQPFSLSLPSHSDMGSQLQLSDSDLSTPSVTSRRSPLPAQPANPPVRLPPRPLVVAPAGLGLGARGWDAGAGPSRSPPPAAAASIVARPDDGPWLLPPCPPAPATCGAAGSRCAPRPSHPSGPAAHPVCCSPSRRQPHPSGAARAVLQLWRRIAHRGRVHQRDKVRVLR